MNNVCPLYLIPSGSGKLATPSSKHLSRVSRLILHRKSPLSDFAKFVMRKSRKLFSSMISERWSSATFLAWWIVSVFGSLIDRMAFKNNGMSVLLLPIGDTGEMSTTIIFSTSCGCLNAKCIIARPPIEWPRTAAFSISLSFRNFAISSDIEL